MAKSNISWQGWLKNLENTYFEKFGHFLKNLEIYLKNLENLKKMP